MASFAEATAVEAVDSYTYSAYFPDSWCIGTVPHGGFVTSVFLRVAKVHFDTTLSGQNQPHTLSLHLEFIRRTQRGPATFKVRDIKLGRQTTVIHVTLVQDSREEVLGYITHTNLHTETGVSFPTGWSLNPAPPPVKLDALRRGEDAEWAEVKEMPFASFRKASQRVRWFFPKKGQALKSMADEWLTFRENGQRFTQESLGYIADAWPQLVEVYRASEDQSDPTPDDRSKQIYSAFADADKHGRAENGAPYWYPTVVLNLDVKKALPKEGVEWLFVRVRAKQIKNGRLDLEVVILDECDDVVALSHHISLVVGTERNVAQRRKVADGESKL